MLPGVEMCGCHLILLIAACLHLSKLHRGFLNNFYHVIEYDDDNDDDDDDYVNDDDGFRFNSALINEDHLRQNGIWT